MNCQQTRHLRHQTIYEYYFIYFFIIMYFIIIGQQEGNPACKKLQWWGAGCPSCRPINSVKALKAHSSIQRYHYVGLSTIRFCSSSNHVVVSILLHYTHYYHTRKCLNSSVTKNGQHNPLITSLILHRVRKKMEPIMF